ncbi:hypothetical protein MHTCC0001_31430 [Flavobacteriaceae bacterium MHTCC 0001]
MGLCAISSFSQTGINYKAIIKDNTGVIVSSRPVTLQFIIYQGDALTNNVYKETHTVNTDANGLVILTIGNGISTNTFADIDWGADNHFLNVQVNTGNGLVDLGTTQFMAAPYAKYSEVAGNTFSGDYIDLTNTPKITTPTGLEAIDEGNGVGWRLSNTNPDNYGDIGENAVDLSSQISLSDTRGASGFSSFVSGFDTRASGTYATAFGRSTIASGDFSIAMGNATRSTGFASTSAGIFAQASGEYSTAIGFSSRALSYAEVAIGYNNTEYTPISTTSPALLDRLFVVGKGSGPLNRSDALIILKNGTITAPSFDISEMTDNRALLTREFLLFGNNNIRLGNGALKENTTGFNNVGIGLNALQANTNADFNTAIGDGTLYSNTTGNRNTAIGALALFNLTTGSNNIGIGNQANVPNAEGSNQIRIGNSAITYAGVQVGWTITSDKRWKDKIRHLPYGLDMVKQLKPVDYIRKNNEKQTREMGFIAQDLEKTLQKLGYDDQGFLTKDDDGFLSVRYTDFIALLTKAIQEQQRIIEKQNAKIDNQNIKIDSLTAALDQIDSLHAKVEALSVVLK